MSAVFGGLAGVVQLITAILSWEQQRNKGVGLGAAGVGAGVIAMAVFIDYFNKHQFSGIYKYSWSFILCCGGWILMLLGTIAYNAGTE